MPFIARPKQQEMLAYRGGKMGVIAVPGSGKTHTLSYLAATLVAEGGLADDQEVLIVTLVNAAVDHFAQRVGMFMQERGLLPGVGYRVRTLHGLAHDILRERPDLVGLSDDLTIIDDATAAQLLQEATLDWLRAHPNALDEFLTTGLSEQQAHHVRTKQLPDLVTGLANAFIRQAKDLELTPADIKARLDAVNDRFPLLEMGLEIYQAYQRALNYRGGVDFSDLIRLALQTLRLDPALLAQLRHRWPYILEDEAQDSSLLQESILRLLTGETGNWVRVGDPNQAIYETFTTASPEHLRRFITESDVVAVDLPDSGRSMPSVIALANELIRWTYLEHPMPALRKALAPPYIRPTPPDDPQPNPPDQPERIYLSTATPTPDQELAQVVKSLKKWLPQHPEATVAVLVPRNERGAEVVAELKKAGLPHVEVLRSTRATRETARHLATLLFYLADPGNASKLAKVYGVWARGLRETPEGAQRLKETEALLRKCPRVEDYLWPRAERDWLGSLSLPEEKAELKQELNAFREQVRRWHAAVVLPVDQLLLTLAQDLFTEPAALATAHRLALALARYATLHPELRLPELAQELQRIAENERKFAGVDDDDTGFDPEQHRGKVVVTTMHKAKGLEWDRVYLLSVNNYDFPSAQPGDTYIGEKWFLRADFNAEAELVAQLKALTQPDGLLSYVPGQATLRARVDYAAERLRLLYVGITRARKELLITTNRGREQHPATPAVALVYLKAWYEGYVREREKQEGTQDTR